MSTDDMAIQQLPTLASTPLQLVSSLPSPVKKEEAAIDPIEPVVKLKPDSRFWALMAALMASTFLAALDVSCVAIALPTIAVDLDGARDFIWVGSAYALTSTALIPWTGSLAGIYGRKLTLLVSIAIFAVGSAICGAAPKMPVMIVGRSIAGIGGGGIVVLTSIVVIDLIPLAERGPFFGLLGSMWGLASTVGPPLSGALTTIGQWRWLFWLNLPVAAVAFIAVVLFLDVKKPQTTFEEKLALMDWYNAIFVASATSLVLALSWAGSTYPWQSVQVLAPLILGIVGIVFFVWIDQYSKNPTIPLSLLRHPTSLIGLSAAFLQALVMMAIVYFRAPIYFQAALGNSAVTSGINSLPMTFIIAPFAILCGFIVSKTQRYKAVNVVAWMLMIVGLGLLTLLKPDSSVAGWVIYIMIASMGMGLLQTGTSFPTMAPLPPSLHPSALSLTMFLRSFGQVLGIAIGGTVLQNELSKSLPQAFVDQFPPGLDLAFAAIPFVSSLDQPLKGLVQTAFSNAFRSILFVLIGIAALGFLISLAMKDLALTSTTDEKWGMKERVQTGEEEDGGKEKEVLGMDEKVEV